MNFVDVRSKLSVALAKEDDADPIVYVDLVDAIDVPCYMLTWDEPAFEEAPRACSGFAMPVVTIVAGRVEPGETLNVLETQIARVLRLLKADVSAQWAIRGIGAPRVFEVQKLSYIAARVFVRVAVTI